MCPLRVILIFISATLAGFFVIRGLRSQPQVANSDLDDKDPLVSSDNPSPSINRPPKQQQVLAAIGSGLRTLVDMASGRYLWTHLVSSSRQSQ